MDIIEAIVTRRTVPQVKMGPPGPDAEQLRHILAAGAAAPDHGKLRPWRFLTVEGAGREELGMLFERAVVAANPAAGEEERRKQRTAPLRAPLILVVIARQPTVANKIPEVERIASAAAAAQNMLVAAHALGFAGKWSTGKNAYDETIRQGLGLGPEDRIIGFLYIGSYAAPQEPSPRPSLEDLAESWPPPAR